ncbi:MAG: alkylated DNA repair dioxygenase AlkB [Phenylobacterium sp.]
MPLFQQLNLQPGLPFDEPELSQSLSQSLSQPRSHKESIPIKDGELSYIHGFLDQQAQMQLFERLKQTLAWQQDEIKIYGRQMPIPRLQAWYGDSSSVYAYSGMSMIPQPWTAELAKLKQQISQAANVEFNSVLANFYRNGMDKVGYHADNEQELGQRPIIASLSLGCQRKFVLKHNISGEKVELQLGGGSLLIMAGELQQCWKHTLPQQKRVVDGRINLTFRFTYPTKIRDYLHHRL